MYAILYSWFKMNEECVWTLIISIVDHALWLWNFLIAFNKFLFCLVFDMDRLWLEVKMCHHFNGWSHMWLCQNCIINGGIIDTKVIIYMQISKSIRYMLIPLDTHSYVSIYIPYHIYLTLKCFDTIMHMVQKMWRH